MSRPGLVPNSFEQAPGQLDERASRTRWRVVTTAVTILAIGVVLYTIKIDQLVSILLKVEPVYLLLICFTALASRAMRAVKWNLLLRAQGIVIPHTRSIRLCFAGHFFAHWTPAGLGSDAYRVIMLRGHGKNGAVISSLVVERYVGLFCVAILCLLSLPVTIRHLLELSPSFAALLAIAMLVLVAGMPLLLTSCVWNGISNWLPRTTQGWGNWHVMQVRSALAGYRKHALVLTIFILLSVLEVISYIVINYLCACALGDPPSFAFFFCAMPLVYLLLRLPISIQGLGIQEGAFGYVFTLSGLSPELGVAVSLLQRAVELGCHVIPGAILFCFTPDHATSDQALSAPETSG